ncbi:hypothetical protein [Methyloferula stellata]|uniref:hypothetical protein n=1 Tax=Methyloferula stellata TaxID=876270 RepID=UPI00126808E9|nr:hypothetical protein [Methyloferula stellata]
MTDSPKETLEKSRADLLAALDSKIGEMPEWKAFRAIDSALMAWQPTIAVKNIRIVEKVPPRRAQSYTDLAVQALEAAKRPLSSDEYMDFVRSRRVIGGDLKQIKISATSALSKDPRFVNIPWRNGRAWWLSGQPIPLDGPSLEELMR